MSEPKHQTIIEVEPDGNETITIPAYVLIRHLSYLEALGTRAIYTERRKPTSEQTFIPDLISSVGAAWKESQGNELVVTISADKYHNPSLIRAKYLKEHEDFGLKRR